MKPKKSKKIREDRKNTAHDKDGASLMSYAKANRRYKRSQANLEK